MENNMKAPNSAISVAKKMKQNILKKSEHINYLVEQLQQLQVRTAEENLNVQFELARRQAIVNRNISYIKRNKKKVKAIRDIAKIIGVCAAASGIFAIAQNNPTFSNDFVVAYIISTSLFIPSVIIQKVSEHKLHTKDMEAIVNYVSILGLNELAEVRAYETKNLMLTIETKTSQLEKLKYCYQQFLLSNNLEDSQIEIEQNIVEDNSDMHLEL